MRYPLTTSSILLGILFVVPFTIWGQQLSGQPSQLPQRQLLRGHMPAAVSRLQSIKRLEATNTLRLAIGLPLRNREALNHLLHELYDPASTNFHRYLTPAEFTARFGPTEQDYEKVVAFAERNGLTVTGRHVNRVLLDVRGNVADVEKALQVTMRVYQHPSEARRFFAPDAEPSVNESLPIVHISGLDNYALPRPRLRATPLANGQKASANDGSGPEGQYLGYDFRAAYAPDTTLTGSGQSVGLLEFDGYYADDITSYEFMAGLPDVPLSNVLIDGADGTPTIYFTGESTEVEVCLDIDMAISMAPGLSNVVVYIAPNPSPWEDLLNPMATDNLAKQLSCSWGESGGISNATTDAIFQEMAAQGQSFFSASGDGDAYTGLIDFAGDSPYITQVGGTTLTTSGPGGSWASETVWNWGNGIGSGGGISTQYPIPDWQANIDMTANQGSTTMRNTPDVAMTADNIFVYASLNGGELAVGGTSAAAPLWAGFTALINQQAEANGQAPAGFINPALSILGAGPNYASCFHDITTGNNTNDNSPTLFYAVPGYDLCTGWGTPAGQNLINILATSEPLLITPNMGFASSGGVGGPFTITSGSLTLVNAGTNAFSWTLTSDSPWLDALPSNGTLTPGGPATTVTVSLNTAANNLPLGTYLATLWFTNLNDGVGQSRQFILSVISPPTITSQPADQTVLEGTPATFTVAATGGFPLFYQWQDSVGNLTDGGNISGAATANLTIGQVSPSDVGTYSVIVSNFAGVAISGNAFLTLTPSAPVITRQPADHTVAAGQTAVFTVSAIGTTPFFYQWSFNGMNIDDATNATLTLDNVQPAQAGNYAVLVTNIYGSILSSNAALNVRIVPVIISFTPSSGSTGTVVNISGLNFDPAASNNIVYFGSVRAEVTAASVTNLVVTAPIGAIYAPITETVNGLTAWSSQSFFATYAGRGQIDSKSLAPMVDLTGTFFYTDEVNEVAIGDLDGDGKPDLIVYNSGWIFPVGTTPSILIFRNISTRGPLTVNSFEQEVVLPIEGTSRAPCGLALADLDGDGRLDIVVSSFTGNKVCIFQNFCSPGVISTNSFGAQVDLPVSGGPADVAVQDLNGDGRPDVVTANQSSGTVSVLRNLGITGVITSNSFAAQVDFPATANLRSLAVADLDMDGKPDLVTGSYTDAGGEISVLRNTGMVGDVSSNSFAPKVVFMAKAGVLDVKVCDLDGDGKPDLITAFGKEYYYTLGSISVYRNTSLPGEITTNSFAGRRDFHSDMVPHTVAVGDLDGDGKPDVVVVGPSWRINVFKNTSVSGIVSLAPSVLFDLDLWGIACGVAIGDLDGDGRPDISFGNNYYSMVSVHQNVSLFPGGPMIVLQPTSQVVPVGGTATFSVSVSGNAPFGYQWYFNGTNLLAGATDATLTLTDVQLSQAGNYAVRVTNAIDTATSDSAVLTVYTVPPFITTQPTNQVVAMGDTVEFTVAAGGTPPFSYQWYFNNTQAISGATNATLTLTNVQLTQAGWYKVLVANVCGSTNSANVLLTVDSCTPAPSGMIGWWPAEGDANDIIGANNGVLLNGTGFAGGEVGQAFSFSGGLVGTASPCVQIPYSPSLISSRLSVEAWIKPLSDSQNQNCLIYGQNNGLQLVGFQGRLGIQPVFRFLDGNGTWQTARSSTYLTRGKFSHIAGTWDGSWLRVYVNGNPTGTLKPATSPVDSGCDFFIGGIYSPAPGSCQNTAQYFNGLIDEVSCYNRDLTIDEIRSNYNAGVAGKCPSSPPVILSQPTSQTVGVGRPVTFRVVAGGSAILSYQWQLNNSNIPGATSSTYSIASVTTNDAGNYAVRVSNFCCSTISSNAVLTVAVPPVITQQPVNVTTNVDGSATFTAVADGTNPLFYQWQKNGAGLTNSDRISGADSSTLTLTNLTLSDAGIYNVLVTNTAGSAASLYAVLRVWTPSGVVAWGYNDEGQTNVPSGLTNAVAISAGAFHCLAVKSDGTVTAWGNGGMGETNVPPGLTNVVAVAAGEFQSLALKADGTVVAWGMNAHGLTNVPAGLTDVVAIAAGDEHNLALKRNGTVVAWGNNDYGQTNVPPNLTNVVAIAASQINSLALKGDGTVAAWGDNEYGQTDVPQDLTNAVAIAAEDSLGLALKADGMLAAWPVNDVPSDPLDVRTISGGAFYALALQGDGTVVGWGSDRFGQIDIPLGLTNVTAISAGAYYALALGNLSPVITMDPQSQTVMVGSDVTFTVEAGGNAPLSYQWYFNGTTALTGETNTSLTLTSVQPAQAGSYSVVVTNVAGSATSADAVLTVNVPPIISQQPADQTVCVGSLAAFSVAMSNLSTLPLSYQWFFNATNLLAGATNATLTFPGVQPGQAGNYSVVITNVAGNATSSNAVLTVNVPPIIAQQPVDQTVCAGSSAEFCVTATGSALNYQWLFNGTNLVVGAGSCCTLTNVQLSQAGNYSVVVSNSCGWVSSSNAILTVNVDPVITQQPVDVIANVGGTATFTVAATGIPTPSYQWRKSDYSLVNGGNISGADTGTLTLTNLTPRDAGIYSVVVSNVAGRVTSTYAVLRVWFPSSIVAWGYDNASQTEVPAGLTNAVAITSGAYHNLALRNDGTVVPWGDNSTHQTNVPPGLTNTVAVAAGYYFNLALQNNGIVAAWGDNTYHQTNVPSGLANVVMISAGWYHSLALRNDGSVVAWGDNSFGQTNVPAGLSNAVAVAGGFYHSLALRNDGTVTTWGQGGDGQTNVPAGLSNVVAIAAGGCYSVAVKNDGTVTAWGGDAKCGANVPTDLANVATVAARSFHGMALKSDGTVTAWGNNQFGQTNIPPGLTNVVAISVGGYHSLALGRVPPMITSQPANQTVCAGSAVGFCVTATGTQPLSYQWQFDETNIAGATGSCYTLTNAQPGQAGNYSVVITNVAGSVTSSNVVLTVNVPPIIGQQPANQTVNQGGSAAFSVTVSNLSTLPLSYQWFFNATNLLAGATNTSLNLTNVQTTKAGNYSVVITNVAGSVTSSNAVLTVNVPPVIAQQPVNVTTNAGSSATFSVTINTNSTPPLSYQWRFNTTNLLAGATNTSLNLTNVQTNIAGNYSVMVTNVAGSVTSSNAVLTVNVPPVIVTNPASQTVFLGSNAVFTVVATPTNNLSFRWRFNGAALAGATNKVLTITNVQVTNAGVYSVVVTNLVGSATSSNACLTVTIVATNFFNSSALKTNGSAIYTNYTLRLTTAKTNQAGSVFLKTPVALVSNASFSTFFSFRLNQGGGSGNSAADNHIGADGIVFVVQTLTNSVVGANGGGMGYYGVTNSVGVEFDTWCNTNNPTIDPTNDGNHIGIDFNGFLTNAVTFSYGVRSNKYSAKTIHIANDLNNSNVWYAWVDYNGANSNLEVRLSETNNVRPATPTLAYTNINLLGFLGARGRTNAYVGFTAATEGSYNEQDILCWQFIPQYQPIGTNALTLSMTGSAISYTDPVPLTLRMTTPVPLQNDQIQLLLQGNARGPVEVQASTDLVQWTTLQTVTNLNSSLDYVDLSASNFDRRFYRIVPHRD